MKNKIMRMVYAVCAAVLSAAILCSASVIPGTTLTACAAASAKFPAEIAMKQETYYTCTISSCAMMIRRRLYLSGSEMWKKVTETNAVRYGWLENVGMKWDWTYCINSSKVNISHKDINGISKNSLKKLLDSHPEGIVLYCTSVPHAVYVCGYKNNTFYCIDPSTGQGGKLSDCTLNRYYGKQGDILKNARAYWFVDSFSISNLNLGETTLTLGKGEKYTFAPHIGFGNKKASVKWKIQDSKIASVNKNGKVTAKANGSTKLIATSGKKTTYCNIKVLPAPKSIKLNKGSQTMAVGTKFKLKSTLNSGAASKTRVFKSSAPSVCSVDQSGNVKVLKKGKATISVKTFNGKTAKMTITAKPKPTSVVLDKKSVRIQKGKKLTLSAAVKPAGSFDDTVTWTSDDPFIATVKNGKITAKETGTTTIRATTYNGKTASCTVTVYVPVKKVTLEYSNLTMSPDEQFFLLADVEPWDASDPELTWTSSDPSVVAVDNGMLEALKKGTAVITAKTPEGKKASCTVTVTVNAEKLIISESELSMNIGEESQLGAQLYPEDADDTLTWSSSDSSVVTVENGHLTAVGKGQAVITVQSSGGLSDECVVNVHSPASQITLDKTELWLHVGDEMPLRVQLVPEDSDDALTWTSSDPSVVYTEDGYVLALGCGEAIVTVMTPGGQSAQCRITVSPEEE